MCQTQRPTHYNRFSVLLSRCVRHKDPPFIVDCPAVQMCQTQRPTHYSRFCVLLSRCVRHKDPPIIVDSLSCCLDASDTKRQTSSSVAALLETLNKRNPEPDTVYLDLRGFEQHQKEEQERMASVSRVLGLQPER